MSIHRWLLAILVSIGLAVTVIFGRDLPGPAIVHADSPVLSFSPMKGAADDVRSIVFAGFANSEVLDLTFTTPNNESALVGDGTAWHIVTEPDGSGGPALFRPSDWLSTLHHGNWTVVVTGESSGLTLTTTFVIN